MSDSPSAATSGAEPDPRIARHSPFEDVLGIVTGTYAASLGLYLLQSADAVTGGTPGLALLIGYLTPWPFWAVYLVVNLPFAVIALTRRGWRFTIRTIISIGAVSAWSLVHPATLPLGDVTPVAAVLGGNLLAGIGLLILFRHGSSLGGFSVIALIVQDATGFRAGWSQGLFDLVVIAFALFAVPWPNVVLSAAGAVVFALVLAMNHRPGRYIGR